MATIRWGIIGCGDVTEVKSGPAFYKARDSQLVAVMRRDAAKAADFARRHGVARWHTDADDIIKARDIDAVYIATRTDTHLEYALRCAAAGKPTYVEKPMAMDATECSLMRSAFAAAGVPLWVAYYRRALPRFVRVKELLESGAIGTPRVVRTTLRAPLPALPAGEPLPWRVDPAYGRGHFFEGACHALDLIDFLFGELSDVHGTAVNQAGAYPTPDLVTATYRLPGGVLGTGQWCYAADSAADVTEVTGSTGRLRYSTSKMDEPITLVTGGQEQRIPVPDPQHVQQPLVQSIVDELNGQGRCPSTGETAFRTAQVTDWILGPSPARTGGQSNH
ncbi:Gfo/Idh/MocA family oxidoreductase [Phytohabitans flavus]|uniref:Gfo/Idh/MocA family protein n=1 Tax=Phytohabitans flavus TaxID=1076124 RepID=UPI0031E6CE34